MPNFSFLSPQDVESIHQATLRILNETGISLNHPGGRKILCEAGARIVNDRVQIPPELVEKCIGQCPKTVSVRGRGGMVKTLGDGNLYFHNLGGARDIFDFATGEKRYASLQDVRDATRLLDALENCHTITPFFTPRDVPGELMSLAMYRHAMPFTTKPLHGPGVQYPGEVKYSLEMAAILGTPSEVLT
ncbi:MAG: trimethylamine methyltransferase family protein, partial [Chloroflexi bacterium]|nr:trimethylamine methyltransferase family protein [Chloroflexota bacterium]